MTAPFIADMEAEAAETVRLKIILPWPDKQLTPNAKRRKHWSSYRVAGNDDREKARLLTFSAMSRAGFFQKDFPVADSIPLTIRFVPPDRRHRDDDGMIGAFKHMRDGIALALKVNDRRFRPVYEIADPEKPGRVEVTI